MAQQNRPGYHLHHTVVAAEKVAAQKTFVRGMPVNQEIGPVICLQSYPYAVLEGHPYRVVSISYSEPHHFRCGNTGSKPERSKALFKQTFWPVVRTDGIISLREGYTNHLPWHLACPDLVVLIELIRLSPPAKYTVPLSRVHWYGTRPAGIECYLTMAVQPRAHSR